MKKTAIALAVAIASLSSYSYARQPSNTFYAGGKVGWSSYHRNSMADFDKSKKAIGGGLFVGYQANPFLGLEVGYDYLGTDKHTPKEDGPEKNKFKVHGVSVSAKVGYPLTFITDSLDIYARGGVLINQNKFKGNGYDNSYITASPLYGGGIEYQMTENFTARIDYQWVNRISNNGPEGFHPDNSLLSLGLAYNFGGPVASQQSVELDYSEKHYVLNEDVLFDYNNSVLSRDGEKALKALLKALKRIDPTKSKIIVIGHTDRIGSVGYNKSLSQARAKAVMNFLVSKGVPTKVISSRGDGKSRPVTGATCNGLSGTLLKACLAPDRRVEIDVRAVNITESVH